MCGLLSAGLCLLFVVRCALCVVRCLMIVVRLFLLFAVCYACVLSVVGCSLLC